MINLNTSIRLLYRQNLCVRPLTLLNEIQPFLAAYAWYDPVEISQSPNLIKPHLLFTFGRAAVAPPLGFTAGAFEK